MAIADSGGACMLTEHVLEWHQSKDKQGGFAVADGHPKPKGNVKEMDATSSKGFMLHDSAQVPLTLRHDLLIAQVVLLAPPWRGHTVLRCTMR